MTPDLVVSTLDALRVLNMTVDARLVALRDRTGDAVCLTSRRWIWADARDAAELRWECWIAAHSTHYRGATAAAAIEAAEDAVLLAHAGDDA